SSRAREVGAAFPLSTLGEWGARWGFMRWGPTNEFPHRRRQGGSASLGVMPMNRMAMGAAALVMVGGFLGGSLPAQELAVRGKTPGNPVLMGSVPDAGKLWGKYARSPLGREVEKARKEHGALPQNSTTAAEIARIEEQLGLSLDPAELFGSTITG